jgi:hypothetical protein
MCTCGRAQQSTHQVRALDSAYASKDQGLAKWRFRAWAMHGTERGEATSG